MKKLAISCGGTGGHFYPGLSLARTMQEDGKEAMLFLYGRNADRQQKIAESYGIASVVLPYLNLPSGRVSNCLRSLHSMSCGTLAARKALKSFAPDAVLGMGSFTVLPTLLAARQMKLPIFLHDGNARIGRANRFFSRWAHFLGTAFPAVNGDAIRCQHDCTGMPLRPELLNCHLNKAEAVSRINQRYDSHLTADKPIMLIFGGSQGASVFNKVLPEALSQLRHRDLQVIHLSGPGKLEEVNWFYSKATFGVLTMESCDCMDLLYRASDLVVARSGGSTVAELALFGKFAWLIPYPYAAENHQFDNAEVLAKAGSADIFRNDQWNVELACAILTDFMTDSSKLASRGELGLSQSKPDASRLLLAKIAEKL